MGLALCPVRGPIGLAFQIVLVPVEELTQCLDEFDKLLLVPFFDDGFAELSHPGLIFWAHIARLFEYDTIQKCFSGTGFRQS